VEPVVTFVVTEVLEPLLLPSEVPFLLGFLKLERVKGIEPSWLLPKQFHEEIP
jgi:hypothetical protein